MSKLKVYVAGAYSDRTRVIRMVNRVNAHHELKLAHDWISVIYDSRMNCKEHELDEKTRVECSSKDLDEAYAADVFWFIVPKAGGRGCWFEAGSVSREWANLPADERMKRTLIASGPGVKCTIFTSKFDKQFDSDDVAFEHILSLHK